MIDVLIFSIKPFFIFCNTLLIYRKLCRIRTTKKDLPDFPISLIFAICIGFLSYLKIGLNILTSLILINLYINLKYSKRFFISLTINIIALSISYLTMEIALIFNIPLNIIIYELSIGTQIKTVIAQSITGLTLLIITQLLFKIKKLQSFIAPSLSKASYQILTLICCVLLIVISFYNLKGFPYALLTYTILFSLICCVFLIFFWFKHINTVYKNHVIRRNIEILESSIEALQKENEYLKAQNIKLSEIIHRDNKVLPALQEAVTTLIDAAPQKSVEELELHLQEVTQQRQTLIADYKNDFVSLAHTGNIAIDSAIKFLYSSAAKENCSFLFYFSGDINLISDAVSITDLVGLICDIGENAIIATRETAVKKIHVYISATDDERYIEIFDSGGAFNVEVLRAFGKRRFTTHKKDGGSGIGLMSIHSLMEKYKFSFELNEKVVSPYCKSIKIQFDNKQNIIIKSQRPEIANLKNEREDFIIM